MAVDFLTEREGYAVGERCTAAGADCSAAVGRTLDGGESFRWTAIGPGQPEGVTFLDARQGYVVLHQSGSAQRLLRTVDGGRTWRTVAREPFYGMPHFVGRGFGYAILTGPGGGPTGRLALSADGGRTWRTVPTGAYRPVAAAFPDRMHGFLAGWRCSAPRHGLAACAGAILGTADGGQNWRVLKAVGTTETGNTGAFAIDALQAGLVYAALPDLAGCTMGGCLPELDVSRDGGQTWQVLQPAYRWGPAIAPGWAGGPQFARAELGWIGLSPGAGPGAGGVLVTTDGGRSFRQFFARRFVPGSLDPVGDVAYAVATSVPPGGGSAPVLVRMTPAGGLTYLWPATRGASRARSSP